MIGETDYRQREIRKNNQYIYLCGTSKVYFWIACANYIIYVSVRKTSVIQLDSIKHETTKGL